MENKTQHEKDIDNEQFLLCIEQTLGCYKIDEANDDIKKLLQIVRETQRRLEEERVNYNALETIFNVEREHRYNLMDRMTRLKEALFLISTITSEETTYFFCKRILKEDEKLVDKVLP
jgi:hypothetical protein